MKKNILIAVSLVLVLFLASSFTVSLLQHKAPSVVYLDLNKTVNEFKFTKELDAKLTLTGQARQHLLDSLKLDLEMLSRKINIKPDDRTLQENYMALRDDYLSKQNAFSKDGAAQSQDYNQQVFKQLNQYIEDYRKEKGYDIVLGANGDGAVMAGNKDYEITADIIAYINNRYEAKK